MFGGMTYARAKVQFADLTNRMLAAVLYFHVSLIVSASLSLWYYMIVNKHWLSITQINVCCK